MEQSDKCLRCCACCLHMGTPHFLPEDLAGLPADVKAVSEWFRKNDFHRGMLEMPCYCLNISDRRCIIHESKPRVCREFEPGSEDCRRLRAHYYGCEYPIETEIERRLANIDIVLWDEMPVFDRED